MHQPGVQGASGSLGRGPRPKALDTMADRMTYFMCRTNVPGKLLVRSRLPHWLPGLARRHALSARTLAHTTRTQAYTHTRTHIHGHMRMRTRMYAHACTRTRAGIRAHTQAQADRGTSGHTQARRRAHAPRHMHPGTHARSIAMQCAALVSQGPAGVRTRRHARAR